MKITVTGGAGYIGSILVPLLLNQGYRITVLDNFYYGQSTLLACCNDPNFEIIRGDCRNENLVRKAIEGSEYIIPLASLVGAPLCNYDQTAAQTVNLDAVKLVLKLRDKQQRVIYPCTNSGYGKGEDGMVTEDSPLNPISLYGVTKVDAEKAVLDAGNSLTFRLATVFGASPRMRLDLLVNDFVYRAVYDSAVVIFEGHFKRNYIHVRDVANAFLHVIKNFDSMQGKPYNCGLSTANLSKLELCAKIKEHLPKFVYMESAIGEDPDKRDYIVSNDRLESTGWKPQVDLDMGIEELIKAYRIIKRTQYANF